MRYYSSADMARLYCEACDGCGDCCRGMGDTVHLDPYDICMLCAGLGKTFRELLDEKFIGLHVRNGVVLPFLQMRDPTSPAGQVQGGDDAEGAACKRNTDHTAGEPLQACPFLMDGRCSIHAFRPGFCRLFPLGREYTDTGVRYFVVENGCDMPGKVKVRIDRWLGIPDITRYEQFVTEWHVFLKGYAAAVREASAADPDYAQQLSTFLLRVFYLTDYAPETFYESFAIRLKNAQQVL